MRPGVHEELSQQAETSARLPVPFIQANHSMSIIPHSKGSSLENALPTSDSTPQKKHSIHRALLPQHSVP